ARGTSTAKTPVVGRTRATNSVPGYRSFLMNTVSTPDPASTAAPVTSTVSVEVSKKSLSSVSTGPTVSPTVSVTAVDVTLPAGLLTTTWYESPLSPGSAALTE